MVVTGVGVLGDLRKSLRADGAYCVVRKGLSEMSVN